MFTVSQRFPAEHLFSSKKINKVEYVTFMAEIHQALLSQFSLQVEFFIGKLLMENYDSTVLKLVNLDPGFDCLGL